MPITPKPRFTHFALFVTDLPVMEKFYTEVIGLTVTDRGPYPNPEQFPYMVFLSSDPKEHHQFVLLTGRPDSVDFPLNQQMSFLVENLDEMREIARRAKEAGTGEVEGRTHGNAWSSYFPDPEGNRIEIYTHTPWYVPQPNLNVMDFDRPDAEIIKETEALCRETEGFKTAAERQAEMAGMMGIAE
jgi:catechol 2,3-dioxygenase-like lactoylglutathione lyase family enzyme